MTNAKQTSFRYQKIIIWLVVILCAYESLAKGWASLFTLPAAIIGLPIYVLLQYSALKYARGKYSAAIKITSAVLSISILAFFICTVGFGDIDEVGVFGFFTSVYDSEITKTSQKIAGVAMYATPAIALLLGWLVIKSDGQGS